MKRLAQSIQIFVITLLVVSSNTAYGRGPGFDKDVNNWSDDNGGDDDDDCAKYYDDDNYDNDDNCDDDGCNNDIPLDGGLSFLAAAGMGLGIKTFRDNRAKNKDKKGDKN